MLVKLSIKNYILIRELEISFSGGFSVITGETGAGKSILVGALGLILGQRADTGILLDKSKKCIVEGDFVIRGYDLEEFFQANDLDFNDSLTLRREINESGKSRSFINDTPVSLTLIKELGDRLVNVHSQNSITTLNDSNFQLAVIDSYAGISATLKEYRTGFARLRLHRVRLEEARQTAARMSGERDYNQFQFDELDKAGLKPGEYEELEEKLELLSHAEEIKSSLFRTSRVISENDGNVLALLSESIHTLNAISKYNENIKALLERLNCNYIDIKDLSNDISILEEQIYLDPSALESVTNRLDLLNRLLKKHLVSTVDELIAIRQELGQKVNGFVDLEKQVGDLEKEISVMEASLMKQAGEISVKRLKVIPGFEKEITGLLAGLGISMAQFTIGHQQTGMLTKDGIDRVRFMFSANKGIDARDLSSTASGGELSRLMLSIKSMIGQKNLLPTIFFDEIDNGVSGEVAGKVGTILKRMGSKMQVIAITHLPQIAGKGEHHYGVFKKEEKQKTTTLIKQLTAKERVEEIAKMLSNEKVTKSAVETANELLGN